MKMIYVKIGANYTQEGQGKASICSEQCDH